MWVHVLAATADKYESLCLSSLTVMVFPKAEELLKVTIQPYISSILDALMEPTSQGFLEVRNVFFRELVDMSKDTLNEGTKEMVAQVSLTLN